MSVDQKPTLAESSPAGGSRLRRRAWWLSAGLFAVMLAVIVGVGFAVKVDYAAVSPGRAIDTEPELSVEGIEDYPSDGELMMATVSVRQSLSVWEYLWFDRDSHSEVIPRTAILGDRSPSENRERNLELMSDSKQTAVAVALEELGFDAIKPNGVLVAEVVEGSSADGVLAPGDVLIELAGQDTISANSLINRMTELAPGDLVELIVSRDDETIEATVTLGARDDNPDEAFLGVAPIDLVSYSTDELGFTVEIDSGDVAGPSAGLAFTLAVLDQLTPGELTGGRMIAATGTMSPDGSVGAVGGVPQKVVAVREAGAEAFLIPASLADSTKEAVYAQAEEMPVFEVSTLDDALEVLADFGGDTAAVDQYAAAHATTS